MQPFRINPHGTPDAYKTYSLAAPISTHRRPAGCQEVNCDAYTNGWQSIIDTATQLGGQQANYIRLHSGRHFTTSQVGDVVTFTFPAGQRCFTQHTVPLDREPLLSIRAGDWRGNPSGWARTVGIEDWVGDFAAHQEALKDQLERG
jgi:hypothetical protein